MARVINFDASGKIQNIIFVHRNGKTFARSRPSGAKRKNISEPERRSQILFGLSSKLGIRLIRNLKMLIHLPFGLEDISQARKWVRQQLQKRSNTEEWRPAISNRDACRLYGGADIYHFLHKEINAAISAEGKLKIIFPALNPKVDISFPSGTSGVLIKVSVIGHPSVGKHERKNYVWASEGFRNDNVTIEEKVIEQDLEIEPGEFYFIVASMHYLTYKQGQESITDNLEWTPVNILGMGRIAAQVPIPTES